ncbi:ABC transporter permease subunit [Caldivirga sp.]|uniref:ABC transporter permease subunit n=1 Tax=Caldivirga sp. TaxID=2080243 RepID=UPI0025C41C59|nr:ABC transporter permease subunit [Caldivirga sp.]
MSSLGVVAISLLATLATFTRVAVTIIASIITGWFLGYAAAKNGLVERVFLSVTQTLEAVPVITFFPIVLVFFISSIRGYFGVELAVDFLVFTAVVWNIWVGEYESIKTISQSLEDVANMYKLSFIAKFSKLYIPATIPRVAGNVLVSFADGLFYITVSEVIALGTKSYHVFGIGSLIFSWVNMGMWFDAIVALMVLVIMVIVAVFGVLRPFVNWAVKYSYDPYAEAMRTGVRRQTPSRIRASLARNMRYIRRITAAERALIPTFVRATSYSIYHRLTVRPRPVNVLTRFDKYIAVGIGSLLFAFIVYGIYSSWSTTWLPIMINIYDNWVTYLYYLGLDWFRILLVTVTAMLVAIPVNYLMVTRPKLEAMILPILEVLASIPVSAYLPLVAIPFVTYLAIRLGLRISLEILVFIVAFLSTAWYVIYNMYVGMKTIPRSLWDVANNLNLSTWYKLTKLAIPGAMPATITGLASTVGSTWGGLEIAEYFQGINGKVYMVNGYTALMDYYTATGNIIGLEAMSLILAINVILLSVFLWRSLFAMARQRYRMEGAISM